MHPKTFYGWYNKLVRGYPYNEKTAYILDYTFNPSTKFLSVLQNKNRGIKFSEPDFKIQIDEIKSLSSLEAEYFGD